MKKLAVAVCILSLSAVSASAGDLAAHPYTRLSDVVAAMYDWSGFYVGANGGVGMSRKCWDFNSPPGAFFASEDCNVPTGAVAGGQIGYRWQMMGSLVFGLEAQGDWAHLRGSNISAFNPVINQSKIDALGLFTGQVGYALYNFYGYLKGGAAVESDKHYGLDPATNVVVDTASETRWGGVIGTGFEVSFAQNWSYGVEYDHVFKSSRNLDFTFAPPVGGFSRNDAIRSDLNIVTARINYRWGGPDYHWDSPIVTKY